MKLKMIEILNYRKFNNDELELNSSFDSNVTILAGVNNSGKTSIMELLRNVFTKEKLQNSVNNCFNYTNRILLARMKIVE